MARKQKAGRQNPQTSNYYHVHRNSGAKREKTKNKQKNPQEKRQKEKRKKNPTLSRKRWEKSVTSGFQLTKAAFLSSRERIWMLLMRTRWRAMKKEGVLPWRWHTSWKGRQSATNHWCAGGVGSPKAVPRQAAPAAPAGSWHHPSRESHTPSPKHSLMCPWHTTTEQKLSKPSGLQQQGPSAGQTRRGLYAIS